MKKIKLFAICICFALAFPIGFLSSNLTARAENFATNIAASNFAQSTAIATNVAQVSDLPSFRAALADESKTEIVLLANINVSGWSLSIVRDVTITGNGYTITSLGDFAAVTVSTLTVGEEFVAPTEAVINKVIFADSALGVKAEGSIVRFSGVSFKSNEWGVYLDGATAYFSGFISEGQSVGVVRLVNASTAYIMDIPVHEDLIEDDEAAEQIKQGQNDPFISPDGKIYKIFVCDKSTANNVNWKTSNKQFKYARKSVTLAGVAYEYIVIPYDDEAPSIMVAARDSVVNTSIDLSKVFNVTDNREAALTLEYSVVNPNKESAVIVGGEYTPNIKGIHKITVIATDSYKNSSTRNAYVTVTAEDIIKPTIKYQNVKYNYTVGELLKLDLFTATDDKAQSVTCTVKFYAPDGTLLQSPYDYKFNSIGVYRLEVSASDGENDTLEVYRFNVMNPSTTLPQKQSVSAGTIMFYVGILLLSAAILAVITIKLVLVLKKRK